MKILCKYYGGSISYGLNTPTSDLDERGIFVHQTIGPIIGLDRYEHQSKQNTETGEDSFFWELRHALNLLRRSNTQMVELIYNKNWLQKDDYFDLITESKEELIDSNKLFKCLMGYTFSERRFVLGERTGQLGGKRFSHLEKYGYSYKNLVQYLRLCRAGEKFFKTQDFPVYIRDDDQIGDLLFDIKNNPGNYTKNDAIILMDEWEKRLKESYNNVKFEWKFNEDLANELIYYIYAPEIENWRIKSNLKYMGIKTK